MAIEEGELKDAAEAIGKALSGVEGWSEYDRSHERYMSVAGGLFAVADAIADLAAAVREQGK